ncbi:hypothetical protein NIES80_27500 [Dolichospermum planctonicum]|uniref:Uncharacterized protein n=1 Tax=Dolichospermum planctonicum TaxID=136072 RepID=A0A480ADZ5_9CYAN|nr:hypothetical protein NIES80_27500 [Dolichospermum planctonicum]
MQELTIEELLNIAQSQIPPKSARITFSTIRKKSK